MSVPLVLNELSLTPDAASVEQADAAVLSLMRLVDHLADEGCERRLRSARRLEDALLYPGRPLAKWEATAERDARTRWRSLVTGQPELAPGLDESDYHLGEVPAAGLGHAHLMDGLAVSFLTRDGSEWDVPALTVRLTELTGAPGSPEVVVSHPEVRHAARMEHADHHRVWLALRRHDRAPRTWSGLVDRAPEAFGSLRFGRDFAARTLGARLDAALVARAWPALRKLDDYSRSWSGSDFDAQLVGIACSRETATTLQQYGSQRQAAMSDGQLCTFDWHLKCGHRLRIYFAYTRPGEPIVVGFISGHLDTALYHT